MSDYGLLQEVRIVQRGSTLAAAALVGDTELLVDYAGDFDYDPDDPDNSGGTLDLNGARLTYSSIIFGELPDDSDTIILTAPLTVAADADDFVGAVSGGQISEDWEAHVTMGEGDQVVALLTVDQRNQWPVGVYADPVPVVLSDDLRHIEDAPGRTTSARVSFWNTDVTTASGPGDVLVTLTHVPIDGSLRLSWNTLDQPPTEWSYNPVDNTVTFPDPDGYVAAGHVVSVAYAYDEASGTVTPPPVPPPPVPLSGLTLRGGSTTTALPAATQVGDLIVVAAEGVLTNSDPRLTAVGSRMFVGYATDLSNVAISSTGSLAIAIATFAEAAVVTGSSQVSTSAATQAVPSLPGIAAVAAITDWHNVSPGTGALPSPWTLAANSPNGLRHAAVFYWFDSTATDTPASTATYNGGPGTRYAVIAALGSGS